MTTDPVSKTRPGRAPRRVDPLSAYLTPRVRAICDQCAPAAPEIPDAPAARDRLELFTDAELTAFEALVNTLHARTALVEHHENSHQHRPGTRGARNPFGRT